MKNQSNVLKTTAVTFVFALAMIVSIPQADAAEWPNILTSNNMTLGSTGQGVVVLQGLLSELGYLEVPTGVSLGYYGQLTKNAVAKYQVARSVSPSVGYFGPLSKVSMHQHFASNGWLAMLGW
jgi:Putative peptidoglycan-binding domain-containing protein